jgi:hypothetical protein
MCQQRETKFDGFEVQNVGYGELYPRRQNSSETKYG